MSVATVTEISAISEKGFEDAVQQAIARANKTLRNIEGAWVKDQNVMIERHHHGLQGELGGHLRTGRLSARREVQGAGMPYKQITQLPDNVKNNLPKHAQEIYKEAFNSAEDHYGEEDRAHRVAWSSVEQKYEKNDKGNWIQKDS